ALSTSRRALGKAGFLGISCSHLDIRFTTRTRWILAGWLRFHCGTTCALTADMLRCSARESLRTAQGALLPIVLLGVPGCLGDEETIASEESFSTAKTFDRHLVLSDEALTDGNALTVAEVQAFLANSPHEKRSGLADVVSNGKTAAQAYVEAGQRHGINPL